MENFVKQTGYCGNNNANRAGGLGGDGKAMSVAPVKVKRRGSKNVVTTYAFLIVDLLVCFAVSHC